MRVWCEDVVGVWWFEVVVWRLVVRSLGFIYFPRHAHGNRPSWGERCQDLFGVQLRDVSASRFET